MNEPCGAQAEETGPARVYEYVDVVADQQHQICYWPVVRTSAPCHSFSVVFQPFAQCDHGILRKFEMLVKLDDLEVVMTVVARHHRGNDLGPDRPNKKQVALHASLSRDVLGRIIPGAG